MRNLISFVLLKNKLNVFIKFFIFLIKKLKKLDTENHSNDLLILLNQILNKTASVKPYLNLFLST
jgi:hypothetical protein